MQRSRGEEPSVSGAWLVARSIELRLLVGAAVLFAVAWSWTAPTLSERLLRDTLVFVLGPLALVAFDRRRVGWRIDRRAIRYAVALTVVVLPFYVVGASVPAVREAYPMIERAAPTLAAFAPVAVAYLWLVVAVETYFRGLCCLGLRSWGPIALVVHVPAYVVWHVGQPPIEVVLSAPAGVLFAVPDYYAESILPSVVAHWVGLLVLELLVGHPPLVDLSWLPLSAV